MGAGGGDVGGASGQGGRVPEQFAGRPGDGLDVHSVLTVLAGKVALAVADPVAFRERPVDQDVLGDCLTEGLGEGRCSCGKECSDAVYIGVGGALADPEAGGELGVGGVLAQVDQGPPVWRELAAAVTLTSDDQHCDPLDESVRRVQ